MLDAGTIVAFIATVQPARARRFYEDVLGLRAVSEDQFAVVFDSGGVQLRMQKVQALQPHPFTSLGWFVPDIHARVLELRARGVVFERYGFMQQDDLGIWQAPSGAKVAWFKDPDGNLLSLTEADTADQPPPRPRRAAEALRAKAKAGPRARKTGRAKKAGPRAKKAGRKG